VARIRSRAKGFHQEVELLHNLEPMEASEADAKKLKNEHGAKCDIGTGEGGGWFVKFKEDFRILVPGAFEFNCHVTGQVPTGREAGQCVTPTILLLKSTVSRYGTSSALRKC